MLRRSWFEVDRRGLCFGSKASGGVGDDFRTVVTADVRRGRLEAGVLFLQGHYVLGCGAPTNTDSQAEPAVIVGHVEELKSPPIGGGVELEFNGLYLVRVFGLVTPH